MTNDHILRTVESTESSATARSSHRRFIAFCVSVILLACATSDAYAQQVDAGRIQVTTRLVVLDVRVVDRNGHFVPGLDKTQFEVFENKTPQTIRNFEGPEAHAMPKGVLPVNSTGDLEKLGNVPVNVLVIDELNTGFSDTARARDALQHFLEKQPPILPVPTLLLGVGNSRVAVLHDFTQYRDELLASLKSHHTDVDLIALANQMSGGSMSAQEGFTKTLGALAQVASSLRGLPGHKNLIWVGSGFDQAYDLTQASDSDAQDIANALELVTQRMMESHISLSTIDPVGVDATADVESLDAEAQVGVGTLLMNLTQDASFDNLAETTGGTVVHGRNDLGHLIAQDTSEASDYYTLTYAPTSPSNDPQEFRQISVVMRNPNLRAITRMGYYPAGVTEAPVTPSQPKTETREFKFDLMSSATSRMVYTGLHVVAEPSAVGYNVQMEARDLHWNTQDDGDRTSEFSVLGVAFNARDQVVAHVADEFKERIKGSDNIGNTQVGVKIAFAVPLSAGRVRFIVRDAATGNIGSFDIAQHKN
jgi:VWFA-related protein